MSSLQLGHQPSAILRRAHCNVDWLVDPWQNLAITMGLDARMIAMGRAGAATAAAALLAVAAVTGMTGATGVVRAQQSTEEAGGLEVLQLRPNFYMIVGAGGNIGVQAGPDGVVVVDAGSSAKADAVVAAIRKRTDRPIRYVIDTSADPDHVGGNEPISKAGETLFNLNSPTATAMTNGGAATILSAEKVLSRMSARTGQVPSFPAAAWPTETFFQPRRYMYINSEGIEVLHQPAAHTDGDSVVFFRRSDVVVAGDIFDTTRFPMIDVARGGSIQGEIDALNRLVDLAIPSIPFDWRDEGTYVIPGHGRLCDQPDVVEYRDMVVIIRDRIQAMVKQGKTLAQITAASPTQGYTRRYGADSGPWTTDMFVEAIYKSLTRESQP
jgi:glyoxylase-like metal-dependent hydrolase (beta-lactamase superfamily II)